MSISYSAIVGRGKVTLPSVESWGNNTVILRDPPRSIQTRRKNRVGQTSEITQMIGESGDRISGINECILVYPRGVNPMVAVDYNNSGNMGGQRIGGSNTAGFVRSGNSGKQASLPYRIMNGGAFRPPIRDLRDLLPLSRLPRVWTSSYTQPGFTDFSKKAMCPTPDTEFKGVKTADQMLKPCVTPNAVYHIETPVIEPFEVRYVIKNPLSVQVTSGEQSQARFNGEMGPDRNHIVENPIRPQPQVNRSSDAKKQGDMTYNTEKYTHDVLQGQYDTNRSRNVQVTSIEDLISVETGSKIKENFTVSYEVPKTSYEKNLRVHGDINLDRVTPLHQIQTGKTRNVHTHFDQTEEREYTPNRPVVDMMINRSGGGIQQFESYDREYHLKPTINPGGFSSVPTMPVEYHDNEMPEFDQRKVEFRRKIYDMQQDRNTTMGSIPFSVA